MGLRVVTPAVGHPLALAKAKRQLHLYHGEDDEDLADYIAAGTEWLEARTRRAFTPRTYELVCEAFPDTGAQLLLPKPPAQSVASVKYLDGDQVLQTWDAANWHVDLESLPARIYPGPGKSWPTAIAGRHDAVLVEYVAGYATMPALVGQCLRLLVAHQYTNREPIQMGAWAELPFTLRSMVGKLRVVALP